MDPLNALFHFSLFFSSFALFVAFIQKTSVHQIPEGYVGVYYRRGKLLDKTTDPGLRTRFPGIESYNTVLVRTQVNEMRNIHCRTQDGIEVQFPNVVISYKLDKGQVVNLLREWGKDFRRMLIANEVNRTLCEVISDHTVDTVVGLKPNEINEAAMSLLTKSAHAGIHFHYVLATGLHLVSTGLQLELEEIAKLKLLRLRMKERELLLVDEARLKKLESFQEVELAAAVERRQLELEMETQKLSKELV